MQTMDIKGEKMRKCVDIIRCNGVPCLEQLYVSVLVYNKGTDHEEETILLSVNNDDIIEVRLDDFMEELSFIAGNG